MSRLCLVLFFGLMLSSRVNAQAPVWGNYNGNAQHTGLSTVALAGMNGIKWSTPVDLNPQYSGTNLLIHYGSPLATAGNTIIVPVKTGASGGYQVEAHRGSDGALLWTQTSDYALPPHNWVPSYSPTITPTNQLYFAGEAGTVSQVPIQPWQSFERAPSVSTTALEPPFG